MVDSSKMHVDSLFKTVCVRLSAQFILFYFYGDFPFINRNAFGATSPPFIDYLKDILRRYPDGGQILKELIQNADDAGATEVVFIHDERTYGTETVWTEDLVKYQEFTEEDWRGIQSAGRSVKRNDPNRVGRFGIGFNSVYHITVELDLCSFIERVPEDFQQYRKLLTAFGVKISVTDGEVEEILHSIKQNIEERHPPHGNPSELKVVVGILNWMRKGEKSIKDDLPVPVMVGGQEFNLQPLSSTVFCDISEERLEDLRDSDQAFGDQEVFHVIHGEVPTVTANWLKIPFLSTRLLNPEIIGIEQCGQTEPITLRVKNILKEYNEDKDLFKELIQNAEDSGANICRFMVDLREHKDPPESLIDQVDFDATPLREVPLVLVEGGAALVKPSRTVLMIQKDTEFRPYLYKLPPKFTIYLEFFEKIICCETLETVLLLNQEPLENTSVETQVYVRRDPEVCTFYLKHSDDLTPKYLEEIKREIDKCLREIWSLPEDEKRKAIRRLYLKWHPDKNPECVFLATEAYKYLKQRIQDLEQENMNFPSRSQGSEANQSTSEHSRNFSGFYQQWDQEASRHQRGRERFQQHHSYREYNFWDFHGEEIPRPNKAEARRWHRQAECDLTAAQRDIDSGSTEWCLFKVHQAVEKALISAALKKTGKQPADCTITHLAEKVSLYSPRLSTLSRIVKRLKRIG
ncbi:hypothetical protein JZ751_020007, partial [Albula glossodonta]